MSVNLKKVLAQFTAEGVNEGEWLEIVLAAHRELAELENNYVLLLCLQNAGVADWDGYDIALEKYNE
jgi:hypothetical protein